MILLRQWWALARLTALDTIRHPICLMLTLTCLVLMEILPLLVAHELGEQGRLARDEALAFHFVAGLLVAGYAACASLRREIQTGILSTVLSKSVSRELFFLAKFSGVVLVVLLYSTCAALATLLCQRATPQHFQTDTLAIQALLATPVLALTAAAIDNYLTHKPFAAHALLYLAGFLLLATLVLLGWNREGRFDPSWSALEWRILPVSLLITFALVLLAAIGLVLAIRLNTVPTIGLCALVFVLGLMAEYLFGTAGDQGGVWRLARGVIPDWQRFWAADALNNGGHLPAAYLAHGAIYAGFYLGGTLSIGAIIFRHSEML